MDTADDPAVAERLGADQELVEAMRQEGFHGPVWQGFAEAAAQYGLAVLHAWLRDLSIFAHCAAKGIPLAVPEPLRESGLTAEEIEDLANETVARAITGFRNDVLIPGRWSAEGGATLKTFFVGQCLLKFSGVFRAWWRQQQRRRAMVCLDAQPESVIAGFHDPAWDSDPADAAVDRAGWDALLAIAKDDRTRQVLRLRAEGYRNAEIGKLLGVSDKTIERVLHQHRQRAAAEREPISERREDTWT